MADSEEELKSLLMKVKEESEKAGLKLNIQKAKIMASGPITSWWMFGWHHWLNGHKFEQTSGDSEGQEAWCVAVHGAAKSRTCLSD